MKKQLLIAAVAASMTSVAMADISITGTATANILSTSGTDALYSQDLDLKITGKTGDTSAVIDLETLSTGGTGMDVKNSYMSTSIAGANIKIGDWYGSDSLLGNGTNNNTEQLSVDYTMSGVKVQYEAEGASDSVTISGSVGGVAISHEVFDDKTDTKFSGSVAGVAITYRKIDNDVDTADQSSLEISTEVSGVKLGYAKIDRNAFGTSDAFFGTYADADSNGGSDSITDATGFSISTSVAGNNVTFKALDVDNVDTNKVIINRPMAGGTFEATFADKDGAASSVDLELKVSF
jgi:hypothetical protein